MQAGFFFLFFFSHLIIEEDIFKPGCLCVCSQVCMQVMGRRKIYKCTEQPALNLIAKSRQKSSLTDYAGWKNKMLVLYIFLLEFIY